jgi:hypothetical protein
MKYEEAAHPKRGVLADNNPSVASVAEIGLWNVETVTSAGKNTFARHDIYTSHLDY